MNRVWISGRIVDAPPAQAGERVFVIRTFEGQPKRVLTKYRGNNPLAVGDLVESHGEMGDQEPVVVGGETVTTADGRVAMRNVYRATLMFRLVQAEECSPTEQVPAPNQGPKPGHPANTASQTAEAAGRAGRKPRKEVGDVRGPELPWQ